MFARYLARSKHANRVDHCWDAVVDRQVYQTAGDERWVAETINRLEVLSHQQPARESFVAELRSQLQATSAGMLVDAPVERTEDTDTITMALEQRGATERGIARDTWLPPIDVSIDQVGRHLRLRRLVDTAAMVVVVVLVLVTVISLVERSIGADQQLASPPGVGQETPAALLPRDGNLITTAEATERVRRFLGEAADFALTFVADEGRYQVAFTNPERAGDEIFVDADTGEIVSASFPSRTTAERPAEPLSTGAAQALAAEYAGSRFFDFAALEQMEASEWTIIRIEGGLNRGYRVGWRLRASESAMWLPTQVMVTVNLDTGGVYAYEALRHPYAGPTQPAISRDAAILLVGAATEGDPRYGNLEVSEVVLIAGSDDTLYWLISLLSTETSIPYVAIVDATTGEVVDRIVNATGAP